MDEELLDLEPEQAETEPPDFAFATVGEVYSDGVSLIFDGETEASDKHYKVNTSIVFHAGDRVKIARDAGTYVAEYVVGNPGADAPHELPAGGGKDQALRKTSASDYAVGWADVHEVPSGGSAGQVLAKKTGTNYDTEWANGNGMPAGGSAGQALRKSSSTDYAASWQDVHEIPSGGSSGQALRKTNSTNYNAGWADVHELPSGGSAGQVLAKSSGTNYDVGWVSAEVPSGGTTGQALRKTSNTNYAVGWGDVHEPPSGGSTGQALVKKTNTNYDMQWAELIPAKVENQYNTSANYAIQFRTTSIYGTPVFQIRFGSSGTWYTLTTS